MFEDHRSKHCLDITWTSFSCSRSMWPWPMTRWHQHQKGSSTGHPKPSCQVWGPLVQTILSYHSNKLFTFKVTVNFAYDPASLSSSRAMGAGKFKLSLRQAFLNFKVTAMFDPITSKSIGVIFWSHPSSMSSLRAMGAGNVELTLGQAFHAQGHCDIDLGPNDLKINRINLLAGTTSQVKFEENMYRHCWVIIRTNFGLPMDRHVQGNIPLFFEKKGYHYWKELKTLWQKKKLLVLSNFYFCHNDFKSHLLQMRHNASASAGG